MYMNIMDLLKRMKEIFMYLYGKISKTLSEKSKVDISTVDLFIGQWHSEPNRALTENWKLRNHR